MQDEPRSGGFMDWLKDLFLPDEDRHAYGEGISRGGYFVCAQVDDDQTDEAVRILEESNSVEFDARQEEWRGSGWSGDTGQESGYGTDGRSAATSGMSAASGSGIPSTDSTGYQGTPSTSTAGYAAGSSGDQLPSNTVEEEHIPIVEEQLRVSKREVSRGGARVRSYVQETPVHEQVSLREEHVSVERRPVDRELGQSELNSDADVFRDRTIEMTETAEEAIVDKQARVTEEVVVRKSVIERTEQVDDDVRHTKIEVDEGARASGENRALGSSGGSEPSLGRPSAQIGSPYARQRRSLARKFGKNAAGREAGGVFVFAVAARIDSSGTTAP